ncbi:hypothetical protein D3C78_1088590 [compost metagenome]
MRRADTLGEGHHFFGHTHFEVHARLQHVLEHQHVALLDMPAVFAQVHSDAVGARLFGVQRGLDRVGVARTTRLAQGRHVVDVHAEEHAVALSHEEALLKIEPDSIRRAQRLRNSSRLTSGRPPRCTASA